MEVSQTKLFGDWKMFKQSGITQTVTLDKSDLLRVVRLIRSRQDDVRKVTEEYSNHDKMVDLDSDLEALKMRIVKQL